LDHVKSLGKLDRHDRINSLNQVPVSIGAAWSEAVFSIAPAGRWQTNQALFGKARGLSGEDAIAKRAQRISRSGHASQAETEHGGPGGFRGGLV
jgi:hypothetical protein